MTLPARPLPRAFFARDTMRVARSLLGCILVADDEEGRLEARITETEAYTQADPASHSHRGKTARNAVMFGEVGHAYVYFTYGAHFCLNTSAGPPDSADGVLLRAAEPLLGLQIMARRRGLSDLAASCLAADAAGSARLAVKLGRALLGGPGKLGQAFRLDRSWNGLDLTRGERLWIEPGSAPDEGDILASPRIGISVGADKLWRFTIAGDEYTSRPQRRTGSRKQGEAARGTAST
ncbi:MAG TPA: DNA-3-methyladenine glycosylase [Chthonomonadales bacterium]|nr:DNA-3-methyladenine glycosylase [Chthonomonadales bacterium]